MGVRLFGVERQNRRLQRIEEKTNEAVRDEMELFAEKVLIRAKRDHRYRSRSGNLKRSTKKKYKFRRLSHTMTFYLDGTLTTIRSGRYAGKSYGVYQHEGTRHIRKDPFLIKAVQRELPKFRRNLRRVPERVRRMI